MPRLKASNFATTTLATTIDALQTSFSVDDVSTFPVPPFRIVVDVEIMEVGAVDLVTKIFSTVTRALEGSVAVGHGTGAVVANRLTTGTYDELATTADITTHATASPIEHPDLSIATGKLADGAVTDVKLADGSATDDKIGNRTVDQATATPFANTGKLTQLLSWIAKVIKTLTGTANWYDAPATTLAAAKTHADATAAGVHGSATGGTANTLAHRDSNGDLTSRRLISTMANGTPPMQVTSQTVVTNLNADMIDGAHLSQLPVVLAGGISIQSGRGSSSGGAIVFPVAFATTPIVLISYNRNSAYAISVAGVSTTGATVYASADLTYGYYWIAIGS